MWLLENGLITLNPTSEETQLLKTNLSGKADKWIKSQLTKSISCFPSQVLLPWAYGNGQCVVSAWYYGNNACKQLGFHTGGLGEGVPSYRHHTGGCFSEVLQRKNAILGGGRCGYSIRHWVKELCEIRNTIPSLLASVFFSEGNFEFWKLCDPTFFYAKIISRLLFLSMA